MNSLNKIIIISGPTASGKTSTAIELAKRIQGEVINFDSLLFYQELSIGTARPLEKEMDGIIHHLVGTESIKKPINAADFVTLAIPIIQDCHAREITPILTGGSGFYLQALLKGMYTSTTSSTKVLERSETLYAKEGITPFRKLLKEHDIESFNRYHENDHYRTRRAVEHFWTTGKLFSDSRKQMDESQIKTNIEKYQWEIMHCYLNIPKKEHWDIIQRRSKKMIEDGLEAEVSALLNAGFNGEEKPLKSIGYKETIQFIRGDFLSKDDYIERLNINTRRLAKSQRTWFNKQEKTEYNPLTNKKQVIKNCCDFLGIL